MDLANLLLGPTDLYNIMRKRIGTIGSKVPLGNVRSKDQDARSRDLCERVKLLLGTFDLLPVPNTDNDFNGQCFDIILKGTFEEKCRCRGPEEPYLEPGCGENGSGAIGGVLHEADGYHGDFCTQFFLENLGYCYITVETTEEGFSYPTIDCRCDPPHSEEFEITFKCMRPWTPNHGSPLSNGEIGSMIWNGITSPGSGQLSPKDEATLEGFKNSNHCDCRG